MDSDRDNWTAHSGMFVDWSPDTEMSPAAIEDKAFRLEPAYIVSVNVPSEAAEKV